MSLMTLFGTFPPQARLGVESFIKARVAAPSSEAGRWGLSFHSEQSASVQSVFICLGSLPWTLLNSFFKRIFCLWVSPRLQYTAAVAEVSPDFSRPLGQAFFLEWRQCREQLARGGARSRERLCWRKPELFPNAARFCVSSLHGRSSLGRTGFLVVSQTGLLHMLFRSCGTSSPRARLYLSRLTQPWPPDAFI